MTLISTNCGNPLTVTVPYFSNTSDPTKFGETLVTVLEQADPRAAEGLQARHLATRPRRSASMTFTFNYGDEQRTAATRRQPFPAAG